mmetsp:Transcript_31976/g.72984  ORF Transcript_31976/g.72984 Transcript_31976/m.72984 type:complete len:176 (+) Transcript_31976:119-646(+)
MQKLAQLLRSSVLPCSTAARCLRPSRRSDLMPLLRDFFVAATNPLQMRVATGSSGSSGSSSGSLLAAVHCSSLAGCGLSALSSTPAAKRLVRSSLAFGSHSRRSDRVPLGVRGVKTMKRNRMRMKMHRYIKNVKRVKYVSVIPQYTGPLGRQTKKKAFIRSYKRSPRLRQFKRER